MSTGKLKSRTMSLSLPQPKITQPSLLLPACCLRQTLLKNHSKWTKPSHLLANFTHIMLKATPFKVDKEEDTCPPSAFLIIMIIHSNVESGQKILNSKII